jgi:hypothetical protein
MALLLSGFFYTLYGVVAECNDPVNRNIAYGTDGAERLLITLA